MGRMFLYHVILKKALAFVTSDHMLLDAPYYPLYIYSVWLVTSHTSQCESHQNVTEVSNPCTKRRLRLAQNTDSALHVNLEHSGFGEPTSVSLQAFVFGVLTPQTGQPDRTIAGGLTVGGVPAPLPVPCTSHARACPPLVLRTSHGCACPPDCLRLLPAATPARRYLGSGLLVGVDCLTGWCGLSGWICGLI